MPNAVVSRFFGGPPLAVLVRLTLLCVLVGVILHALGFDPGNIIESIRRLFILPGRKQILRASKCSIRIAAGLSDAHMRNRCGQQQDPNEHTSLGS